MSEELKPCPYCGAKPPIVTVSDAYEMEDCKGFQDKDNCPCFTFDEPCGAYTVVCDFQQGGCGASCGYASYKEKAIKKWNLRI